MVAEAHESSEAEKTKWKIAALSLASQMALTRGLLESTNKKKENLQVEHIRDRVRDVSFNLSKISLDLVFTFIFLLITSSSNFPKDKIGTPTN